jgi:hypothetical protein
MIEILERVTPETLASQKTTDTQPRFSKEKPDRKKELESFARFLSIAEKHGITTARKLAEVLLASIKGKTNEYDWAREFASEKFILTVLMVGIRGNLETSVDDVRQKIFENDPIFTKTDEKIRYVGGYLEKRTDGQMVADIYVYPPFLADTGYSTVFRARVLYPHTDEHGNIRTITAGEQVVLEWRRPLSKFEPIKLEIPLYKSAPDRLMNVPQKFVEVTFQVEIVAENSDPSKKYEERYRRILIPSTQFLRIDHSSNKQRENN